MGCPRCLVRGLWGLCRLAWCRASLLFLDCVVLGLARRWCGVHGLGGMCILASLRRGGLPSLRWVSRPCRGRRVLVLRLLRSCRGGSLLLVAVSSHTAPI